MRFAVYDTNGRFKWWGEVQTQSELDAQGQHGAGVVDISDLPGWNKDISAFYYDSASNTTKARVAMSSAIPSTVSVNVAFNLGLPAGAVVSVDGVAVGVVDSSPPTQGTLTDAGTYDITATLWPYLDFSTQVTAS